MNTKNTMMMVLAAGTAMGGLSANLARADEGCSVYRVGVPDLDQKRATQGNIMGLPNDGKMFCAPTSVSNHVGYLNNFGFPNLCLGAKDWQNHYAAGTAYINLTQFYCQVDPFDGGSMMPGARNRILASYPDEFQISSYFGNGVGPTSQAMYGLMTAGCLMTFCYGRYDFFPAGGGLPNRWVRDGGHCVTLTAVLNGCSNNASIGYRNPSSSDSLTEQSPFQTTYFPVRQVTAFFAGEPGDNPGALQSYTILDEAFEDGRLRVIDGMAVIWPTEGLSVDATQGILSAQKFIDLNMGITNGADPTHIGLLLPAVQKIREAAARVKRHPALPIAVVTLDGERGGAADPGLWTCNLGTREWLRVGPVPQGGGCFGPDGRYFFGLAGGNVRAIDPANPTLPPIEWSTREHVLLACGTTDPMTDGDQFDYELIAITKNTAGGVFIAVGDVDGDGCSPYDPEPFPTAIPVPAGCEIGVSPLDGTFVIAREGFSGLVRCGRPAGAAGWVVIETIATPGCTQPKAPHFDGQGRLIYTCDGTVRVLERNSAGQWQPKLDSKWNGLRGGSGFELGRGRDGLSDWANTRRDTSLDPDAELRIVGEGRVQVDCPADFNNDGFIDFFDYDDFVSCFEGDVSGCPANNPPQMVLDMNGDGFVDFFDYDAFVQAFERGC
ncbi:MAG: hypothetical protein HEQ23_12360 [Tepidisphaera sp.]